MSGIVGIPQIVVLPSSRKSCKGSSSFSVFAARTPESCGSVRILGWGTHCSGRVMIAQDRGAGLAAPIVEDLTGTEPFVAVLGNTYMNYLPDPERRVREFELLGRVVAQVPIRRIQAMADLSMLHKLVERHGRPCSGFNLQLRARSRRGSRIAAIFAVASANITSFNFSAEPSSWLTPAACGRREPEQPAELFWIGDCGSHLNQSFGFHSLEKFKQIPLAPIRFHIVFVQHRVTNVRYSLRLLQKFPDARADSVNAIIDTVFHIQDSGFFAQRAGNLILTGNHDRVERKG